MARQALATNSSLDSMPPSRRRNNSSLFESSTIITANLIMASSSYLLSRITPRAPTSPTAPPIEVAATAPASWSPTTRTRSIEPMAGSRAVFMEPDDGQCVEVDQEAERFIKKFRERTLSETARHEATARPPQPPMPSTMSM